MMLRRTFLAAGAGWGVVRAAQAQSRPLTIVVSFAPGGPADLIARRLAETWRRTSGRVITVENRAGAGGNVAAEYVARASPDGLTLLFGSSGPLAINPLLFRQISYDPTRDFAPLLSLGRLPNVLLVRSQTKDLADFVAGARQSPLTYGSSGNGATSHLAGAMFALATGVELQHVPYRGTGPALQDLIAGHIGATFTDVLTAAPHVRAGTLRALGVTTPERSAVLPEIMTLHEQGLTGFDASVFFGLVAPARIPAELSASIVSEARAAMDDPTLRESLLASGLIPPASSSPEALAQLMAVERERWGRVISATGVRVD
ncbi:MAG: tripartite tricarboxylate transporter substrate binding protein [Roseococcus sp.]|nr:tripartite tricarboxylate transporter substrate binding protein [Roseococcus sp.]